MFFVREKLLTILLILYVILLLYDREFLFKSTSYLEANTLSLIISLLLVSRGLEFSGFFSRVSKWILEASTGSIAKLSLLIVLSSAISSAIIMNDTSLFIFIPFIITLSRYTGRLDYLLVITTISANIGSSLTPIGNPQNIILWQYYELGFIEFIYSMLPFFTTSLALLLLYLIVTVKKLYHGEYCKRTKIPRIRLNLKLFLTSIILLLINIILAQLGLQVYGLLLTIFILLIINKDLVLGLDYALILIFALMFMDFREISYIIDHINLIPQLYNNLHIIMLSSLLSQVISNVPTTITLIEHVPVSHWKALAVGVNLGGVGFLTGSMANIITLRMGNINVRIFHKYALPYFIILFQVVMLLTLYGIYP